MKIKEWSIGITAHLIDGGTYNKHFYSNYGDKKMTLDELIEWFKKFKESVIIIEEVEEE